tara:strand:- start:287 stop:517 length:231 start_codon:yes stop_codon:yes gene_type:complete
MLDHDLNTQGVDREADKTKNGLSTQAEEAMQWDIRMLRIPKEICRRESINVRQRSENHPDDFFAMSPLKAAGDISA